MNQTLWPVFIKALTDTIGINAHALSKGLKIPYRTMQNWTSGKTTPDTSAQVLLLHLGSCKNFQREVVKTIMELEKSPL